MDLSVVDRGDVSSEREKLLRSVTALHTEARYNNVNETYNEYSG